MTLRSCALLWLGCCGSGAALLAQAPDPSSCPCWKEPDSTYTLAMTPNDDGSSPSITLPFTFRHFGDPFSVVFINNNGNLTFQNSFSAFTADAYPLATVRMVAPFWADVDTRNGGGQVWYKVTPHSLVVNWVAVAAFNQQQQRRNWFQVTITDGLDSTIGLGNTVEYCYRTLQWTTGSASGGVNGFGGTPATVGANRGGNTGQFLQVGRFGQPGPGYDGPFAAVDGLGWLEGRRIAFDLSVEASALAPLLVPRPWCGALQVCTGDTLTVSVDVIGTSPGQPLVTTVDISTWPDWTAWVDSSSGHALVSVELVPQVGDTGSHLLQVLAEGPAQGSMWSTQLQVDLTPDALGPVEGPLSVALEQDVAFSVEPVPNATSYRWILPQYWEVIAGQNTASVVVRTGWMPGPYTLCVEPVREPCAGAGSCLELDLTTGFDTPGPPRYAAFPNPACGEAYLPLDGEGTVTPVEVRDGMGRVLALLGAEQAGNGHVRVDLPPELANGPYLLRDTRTHAVFRILKGCP